LRRIPELSMCSPMTHEPEKNLLRTPKAGFLRLISLFAVVLIDISFLLALDTFFVSQKRALILDSQEEFKKSTRSFEPINLQLSNFTARYRKDEDYIEKAKEYLDTVAPSFLQGEHPIFRILLTNVDNDICADYHYPEKVRQYNTWRNCLFSRSFRAPGVLNHIHITIFYTTPQHWPEIESMVRRYWLYSIAFVVATWLLHLWFYRKFFLPLQNIGSAISTMIRSEGVAMIASPRHEIEAAFNRLAQNQREVLFGLRIDQIVDALHDQSDDTVILESYLQRVMEPIQTMYPFTHVEAYRLVHAPDRYKRIVAGETVQEASVTLKASDPDIICLGVGEHGYGALRCVASPSVSLPPAERQHIAQEIMKQAENGLARALTRSRALTEERNRFGINLATNMGHDLTNIIATGKWDLNTIERAHELGIITMDEKKGAFFLEAVNGLKNNLYFLQEMVNIYRAFGYTRSPRYEEFSIKELVKDITHLFTQSTSKNVAIQLHVQVDVVVYAEPRLLRMAIFNLLGNAAQAIQRHRSQGESGVIDVTLEPPYDGMVRIAIGDNGPGIRNQAGDLLGEHEMNRIFQSGYTTKGRKSGGGLGLAWVKAIMENFHGGSITAMNRPDKGACFVIAFPVKRLVD
jgi:signal transduction histidine kinase